jgi:nucleoside-diphosphate-sugar epimerase
MGVGYTGRRVLSLLPPNLSTGFRSSDIDLDAADSKPIRVAHPCTILYTVPPAQNGADDSRLQMFLSLLDAAPKRIVYLSTSGVYGNRNGQRIDETTAPAPATARAKRRLAAEQLLQQWCADQSVEYMCLRVPGIYGPGRLGLERIESGEPVIIETEANPGNRIHVDDLAACCVQAMTEEVPTGIYNTGDGDHRSSGWFTRTVAALADLDSPREISKAQAAEQFSAARLSFLNEARIVDTTKMREVLRFTPRYPDPEDGIRDSLLTKGVRAGL